MNLKCPKCGGPVVYDPVTDSAKCTACDGMTSADSFSDLDGRDPSQQITYASFKLKDDGTGEVISSSQQEATEEAAQSGFRLKGDSTSGSSKQGFRVRAEEEETPAQGFRIKGAADAATEPSRVNQLNRRHDEDVQEFMMQQEMMETRIYKCRNCGAELMINSTEASTFCGFCGASTIVFDRVSEELKPQKIIPFKLSEEQALQCVKDRFAFGSYIPKEIKELTVDKVRGIYIPYWLYSTYVRKSTVIQARDNHEGDHDTYIYTRDASSHYKQLTFDASLQLNNQISARLEPFYMNELQDFDIAFLAGYYADKFDVPFHAVKSDAEKRTMKYIDDAILKSIPNKRIISIGGSPVGSRDRDEEQVEYQVEDIEYALLPAYFITIRYENQSYMVVVNGQTGKVIANLPADKWQVKRKLMGNLILGIIAFAALSAFIFSIPGLWPVIIVPALFAILYFVLGLRDYRKHQADQARMGSSGMANYMNERESGTW